MNSKTDADFFANMRIKVNAEFYILYPDQKTDRVIFSEVYSVGYKQIMVQVEVGWWTKKDGLVLTAPKFFTRRMNLRRQVLKTASVEVDSKWEEISLIFFCWFSRIGLSHHLKIINFQKDG